MAAASRDDLVRAVEAANIPSLLLVLVQLSQDRRWLAPRYRPVAARGTDDNDSGGLPADVQREIRDAAVAVIGACLDGDRPVPPPPSVDELTELLGLSVGETVDAEYAPMMAEEMGFRAREVDALSPDAAARASELAVLVIGAGLSGVCLGIKLGRLGIPYTIIEKNATVGGTWYENTYPGAGVDTPSHLYSFSFETRHRWTRYYAKRGEIHDYIEACASSYGVRPHIRFDTEVVSAAYDERATRWDVIVRRADGTDELLHAPILVSAVGQLNRPKQPNIEGLDRFGGPVIHSAAWDHSVSLTGQRVAVIGSGASAMQIVPSIAAEVADLTVYQRSPQWAGPNLNYFREVSDETQWLIDNVPYYYAWYRFRLLWMFNDKVHRSLQIDPDWQHPERSVNAVNDAHRRFFTRYITTELAGRDDLVAKSLPDYPPFGKRMLIDNGWYRTLLRPDVELVTDDIGHVEPGAIVTSTGDRRECDVIVMATGFENLRLLWPIEVRGRDGAELHDVWGTDDAQAFLGLVVPGFPNFFTLYGPNTNLGHGGSIIFHTECQVRYVVSVLQQMLERRLAAVECTPDVFEDYVRRVDEAHERMIWSHPGMHTWYRNDKGRVVTNSPWRLVDYWRMTHAADLDDFVTIPASESRP